MLDVPFEERGVARTAGATWYPGYGWAWIGARLPSALQRYEPKPHSWEQWLSDDANGRALTRPPNPDPSTGAFTLRADQEEDSAAIVNARQAGLPEFLVGSNTGTGKTLVAIAAVKRMPNVRHVLVVCPAPVAPNWRHHLRQMGDGGKRWCIVSYRSTLKLLTPPASAATAKKTRTKNLQTVRSGTPKVAWDVVITDESHRCGNPESQQTRAIDRLIAGPGARPAFSVRMSATAGADPAKLSYLHRGLAWRSGEPVRKHISADDYEDWCARRRIDVTQSGFGGALKWGGARLDLTKMHMLLYEGEPQWAVRRVPDWPEQQRILMPLELSADEMLAYEAEWAEFQALLKQIGKERRKAVVASDSAAVGRALAQSRARGLAAMTRYRQKAGQLRAPHTADFAAEMIGNDYQVTVSCEYLGTAHLVRDTLHARGVKVGVFTGENPDTREDERLAFQRGEYQAIAFTPTEGFSLHAGEHSVGGNDVPRVSVVAEPRWSPGMALQVEGRTHRDGTNAPCYYTYATGTIEDKVIRRCVEGMRNINTINGDDTTGVDSVIAKLLGMSEVLR